MMSKLQMDFIKADIEHLEMRKERLLKQIKSMEKTIQWINLKLKNKKELIGECQ